jgi:hypothetical protein
MPCSDQNWGPSSLDSDLRAIRELSQRNDKLARLLCYLCGKAEGKVQFTEELTQWWRDHKEFDEKRKQ